MKPILITTLSILALAVFNAGQVHAQNGASRLSDPTNSTSNPPIDDTDTRSHRTDKTNDSTSTPPVDSDDARVNNFCSGSQPPVDDGDTRGLRTSGTISSASEPPRDQDDKREKLPDIIINQLDGLGNRRLQSGCQYPRHCEANQPREWTYPNEWLFLGAAPLIIPISAPTIFPQKRGWR